MTAHPQQAAFLAHARVCRFGADIRRCQMCQRLDSAARVESYRVRESRR